MSIKRKALLVSAGTAFLGAMIATGWLLIARTDPIRAEYPDPPFARLTSDYPRLIPIDEQPSREDEDAHKAYWKERREVVRYLREEVQCAVRRRMNARLFVSRLR